ncbi:MAG: hypothetical protein WAV09_03950 [Minisyncoccia bacterium]
MNTNTKVIGTILIVALLVLATYFILRTDKDAIPEGTDTTPVATTTTTTTTTVTPPATTPAQALAYAEALKKYADKRIQITSTCQVVPNNATYKNGTTIMIDNRSDKTKSVKIGAVYTVGAYNFKIVTLSSPTLPATFYVDCDKQQNSGTIILQK